MRKDKFKAYKLRMQGKSYTEIGTTLGIPKATLSGWFRDLEISADAKARISKRMREKSFFGLLKRNKMQTHLVMW